ncbi:MAG: 30S ribosomal protein S7 [Candidatus Anstonellales archaeon]
MAKKVPELQLPDKIFDKYDTNNIEVKDLGLAKYITIKPTYVLHTFGRHAKKQFNKSKVNIVERLINCLMRGGTGDKIGGRVIRTHGAMQGKKLRAIKIVKKAFAIVEEKTKSNPVQLLVQAIENSAPREDFTRVSFGGVTYQVAVDIAPMRRLDLAIRNIVYAAILRSFNTGNKLPNTLADEIINASKNDNINSYAVKKKNEIERMAKAAR